RRNGSILPGVVSGTPAPANSGHSTAVSAVGAYDPQGGGGEHDSDAPYATDGNKAPHWRTETDENPDFGGLETAVGIVVNARGSRAQAPHRGLRPVRQRPAGGGALLPLVRRTCRCRAFAGGGAEARDRALRRPRGLDRACGRAGPGADACDTRALLRGHGRRD